MALTKALAHAALHKVKDVAPRPQYLAHKEVKDVALPPQLHLSVTKAPAHAALHKEVKDVAPRPQYLLVHLAPAQHLLVLLFEKDLRALAPAQNQLALL